jgi:hypothetical protein
MATRLTLKVETNYKDVDEKSTEQDTVTRESYIEGKGDSLVWRFENFVKLLIAEGYSLESICKFISTDGVEVWEIGEE